MAKMPAERSRVINCSSEDENYVTFKGILCEHSAESSVARKYAQCSAMQTHIFLSLVYILRALAQFRFYVHHVRICVGKCVCPVDMSANTNSCTSWLYFLSLSLCVYICLCACVRPLLCVCVCVPRPPVHFYPHS